MRLGLALLERDLLLEDGPFLEVRRELPLVRGMGLGDVDEREVRSVAEALEEALDVARPATKRRSGVAAEDEQQRPVANERCELDRLEIVGSSHGDRGKRVSDPERLGIAVTKQARDHRGALRAGGEAFHVGAVLRVDDGGERAVPGPCFHAASIRRLVAVRPPDNAASAHSRGRFTLATG